jgi:hypothetical protein
MNLGICSEVRTRNGQKYDKIGASATMIVTTHFEAALASVSFTR